MVDSTSPLLSSPHSQASDYLTVAIEHCGKNVYDGAFFVVTVAVDGEELGDWLEVEEFFQTLLLWEALFQGKRTRTKTRPKPRKATNHTRKQMPLFTCNCGCFGCGGYYVDVTAESEAIVWESTFRHSAQVAAHPLRRFAFARDTLRDVAGELIAAIYHALTLSWNGEVGCGYAGDNLVPRLPFYLERYEALESANANRD